MFAPAKIHKVLFMEPQALSWWCGVASAQAALECLGIARTQEALAELCHITRRDGTDEVELQRLLLACGVHVDPWNDRRRAASMEWLTIQLQERGPAILCVDNYQHWVTAYGILRGTTFHVYDPAGPGTRYIYSYRELADRWRVANGRGGPKYYAVGVSK